MMFGESYRVSYESLWWYDCPILFAVLVNNTRLWPGNIRYDISGASPRSAHPTVTVFHAGSTAFGALKYRTYTGRTLVLPQNGDFVNGRRLSLAIACIG